ncbi:MAG: HIT family protein, partial [Victivallales bacterium]|nr:HIT family protein [Victivallales bacterium]
KEHQHSSTAIDVEYLKAIIAVAPKIGAALMRATGAEGFNIFQNNGRVAGQTVPHVHFHVVPRFADDGVIIYSSGKKYSDFAEMNAVADKVKAALKI